MNTSNTANWGYWSAPTTQQTHKDLLCAKCNKKLGENVTPKDIRKDKFACSCLMLGVKEVI